MGYKNSQFVTLAGFHALNMSMFHLARGYSKAGMTAYSKLQQEEFASQGTGLSSRHAPALRRHWLLRRDRTSRFERQFFHDRSCGLNGSRAVPRRRAARAAE